MYIQFFLKLTLNKDPLKRGNINQLLRHPFIKRVDVNYTLLRVCLPERQNSPILKVALSKRLANSLPAKHKRIIKDNFDKIATAGRVPVITEIDLTKLFVRAGHTTIVARKFAKQKMTQFKRGTSRDVRPFVAIQETTDNTHDIDDDVKKDMDENNLSSLSDGDNNLNNKSKFKDESLNRKKGLAFGDFVAMWCISELSVNDQFRDALFRSLDRDKDDFIEYSDLFSVFAESIHTYYVLEPMIHEVTSRLTHESRQDEMKISFEEFTNAIKARYDILVEDRDSAQPAGQDRNYSYQFEKMQNLHQMENDHGRIEITIANLATGLGLIDSQKSTLHDDNENDNFFVKQMKQLTKYFGTQTLYARLCMYTGGTTNYN